MFTPARLWHCAEVNILKNRTALGVVPSLRIGQHYDGRIPGWSVTGKIDEPALNVGVDEFDANPLTYIEPLIPALYSSFNGRI